MAEKTRYSDAELEEFRAIINEKLELAQRDYELLKASLTGADGNDTDDTSPTYKVLEEGANTLSKEETTRLAQRQLKFIQKILLSQFEILVTPHNSVYSYRKGLGVKQNAQVHMNNSYLLKNASGFMLLEFFKGVPG